MVAELIRALPAAAAAAVLPGYFWAAVLRPASGPGERLAYSTVLSMASVPVVAILLARIAGTGVALWVAIASALIVLGSGAIVFAVKGAARGPASPLLPGPAPIRNPLTLALTAAVLLLALVATLLARPAGWLVLLVVAGLLAAGALAGWPPSSNPGGPPPADTQMPVPRHAQPPAREHGQGGARSRPWQREGALALVLVLTGYRAYAGVIRHDWPYLRGGDQFSHAVMAEQMLAHGSYGSYLVYPPGFSALTAVICRFAALPPLMLFPVLAPALLVVTALGGYALATRLWGGWYGVTAAGLSGLVLTGSYAGFAEGRYPDLAAAFFLLVMTIAALLSLYESPSLRPALLVTVVAASVALYHSVATLYLAALLALVAVTGLPYLLRARRPREARVLALALAGAGVLSAGYATYIYNLVKVITGHSATSTAVSIALGSQPAPAPRHVLTELGPPVLWLGVFGAAVLAVSIRYLARPPQVLAAGTVLLWCVLMYVGSRTAVDGFPQRFERDLGAPLSVTGALGLGVIARSLLTRRPGARPVLALTAAAAVVAAAMVTVQAVHNLRADGRRALVLSRPVALAGRWLAQHNTGGNIISTPYLNPGISNRAILALGGYTGLQSYSPRRIAHPRSLPTVGRRPLLDSQAVLLHPVTCQAASILARDDVRYVVLYKIGTGADLAAFRADPSRYHPVFDNRSVIIYSTTRTPCGA